MTSGPLLLKRWIEKHLTIVCCWGEHRHSSANIVSSNRKYRPGYRITKIRFEHLHPSPVYYFIFFFQDTASVFAQAFPIWGWKSVEEFCDRWWEAAWKWRLKSVLLNVCRILSWSFWRQRKVVVAMEECLLFEFGEHSRRTPSEANTECAFCFFATKSIRFIASLAYTMLCTY